MQVLEKKSEILGIISHNLVFNLILEDSYFKVFRNEIFFKKTFCFVLWFIFLSFKIKHYFENFAAGPVANVLKNIQGPGLTTLPLVYLKKVTKTFILRTILYIFTMA